MSRWGSNSDLVCVSQSSPEKQSQQDTQRETETYCKELAHTIMQAEEKPQHLTSANWRCGTASGTDSSPSQRPESQELSVRRQETRESKFALPPSLCPPRPSRDLMTPAHLAGPADSNAHPLIPRLTSSQNTHPEMRLRQLPGHPSAAQLAHTNTTTQVNK